LYIPAAVPLVVLAAGCGLIDPDVTDLTLRLPEREVTVDTADWALADEATMPAIDCEGMEGACAAAVGELCAAEGCAGACGGSTCELVLPISLWNTFDLATEAPELQAIDGQPIVSVAIERVWFEVSENSLDVASPELEVAIAPQSVMTLADAEVIGTIPSIEPGALVADGEIALTAGGADVLAGYMKSYATPFNLIVGAELAFAAGDVLPTGRMIAVVHVEASAGL
jgi:hypothetical protein